MQKAKGTRAGLGAKHGWVERVVTVAQAEAYATEKPYRKRRGKTIAPGFGAPDEPWAALFLASDNSSYVTGRELFVDRDFAQL